MKTLKAIGFVAVGLVSALCAQADQITVTSSQQTNGRLSSLTLAFPAVEKASSVWVASGPKDEGTVLGNWQSLSFGADVAAGETSCTVPVNLKGGETAVRLIMLEDTDEYVELESVSASDGAYVTTGFRPGGTSYVRCDFKFDVHKNCALFGARVGAQNNSFCMLDIKDNNQGFRYDYANYIGNSGEVPIEGRRYVAEMDHKSLRIDGRALNLCSRTTGAATFSAGCALMIFAMNNGGTVSSPADATIYSFKAWSDLGDLSSTLVSDLVPCRKKDGTVGLINRKTGGLQTNTGTLTAGAVKAHSTLGAVVQTSGVIDACGLTRTMSVGNLYRKGRKVAADLTFSAALADGLLVAAYGPEDAGERLADWTTKVVLAVVPAQTTQLTAVTIPAAIDDDLKAIRYFLLPRCASAAYDRLFDGVRATGTQYAVTDYTPTWTTSVIADFTFDTDAETQVPFGARQAIGSDAFAVLYTTDQGFRFDYRDWIGNSAKMTKSGKKFRIDASTYLNVDNSRYVTVPEDKRKSFTAGAPLTLFAYNTAGTVGSCSKSVCHSFYAWKVSGDDSTRVLDLTPCEKNGEIGFYNKMNGKFYGNSGTDAFEAVGPETVNTNAQIVAVSAALPQPPPPGMLLIVR